MTRGMNADEGSRSDNIVLILRPCVCYPLAAGDCIQLRVGVRYGIKRLEQVSIVVDY